VNKARYDDGDVLSLVLPSEMTFSSTSECSGISSLKETLTCSLSADLLTLTITLAFDDSRILASAYSGDTVSF